jgi:endonuclease III
MPQSMKIEELKKVIEILRDEYPKLKAPIEKLKAHKKGDPFRVLVCTLLSTRTKDETTAEVYLKGSYIQWVFIKTRARYSKSWQDK